MVTDITLSSALIEASKLLSIMPNCDTCREGIGCLGCKEDTAYNEGRRKLLKSLNDDKALLDEVFTLAAKIDEETKLMNRLESVRRDIKASYPKLSDAFDSGISVKVTKVFK